MTYTSLIKVIMKFEAQRLPARGLVTHSNRNQATHQIEIKYGMHAIKQQEYSTLACSTCVKWFVGQNLFNKAKYQVE